MTAVLQISSLEKQNDVIVSVGGEVPVLGHWKLTPQEIIAGIEDEKWKFFVQVDQRFVWIVIALSNDGCKYITTKDDTSDILSLPACP